jgi:LPS-assembly lipoprotein
MAALRFSLTRLLVALSLTALLCGCGFALRQAPHFAFSSLYVAVPENSALGNALKRSIAANGNVQVLTDAKQVEQAQAVLEVLTDQREKVVMGLNAAGQVTEFQLRLRIRFRLRTPAGKDLIPETEILQQRDVSYSETAALAKEAEVALLYRDMQSDIVQQVMRRIAAVKTL